MTDGTYQGGVSDFKAAWAVVAKAVADNPKVKMFVSPAHAVRIHHARPSSFERTGLILPRAVHAECGGQPRRLHLVVSGRSVDCRLSRVSRHLIQRRFLMGCSTDETSFLAHTASVRLWLG